MNEVQKIIKYAAMAFAVVLTIGIFTGIAGIVLGVTGGISTTESEELVSFSKEFDQVKRLEIDSDDVDVRIVNGDLFRVDATNVPEDFVAELEADGTLRVGYDSNRWDIISFHLWDSSDYEVILTVPSDFVAERADIDNGSGKVEIEDLRTEVLTLSCGSGSIDGSRISADKVIINGGSGSINFEDVDMKNVDADLGSGSFTIQDGTIDGLELDGGSGAVSISGLLIGENEFDIGSGSVSLNIENSKEEYDISCEAGSGGIWIDGNKENDFRLRNKDANNSIEVDGGSGRVSIEFNE